MLLRKTIFIGTLATSSAAPLHVKAADVPRQVAGRHEGLAALVADPAEGFGGVAVVVEGVVATLALRAPVFLHCSGVIRGSSKLTSLGSRVLGILIFVLSGHGTRPTVGTTRTSDAC